VLCLQTCSQHLELFAITMPLQFDNHIADAGASALGQGLKTSRSLRWLNLVRVFSSPFCICAVFSFSIYLRVVEAELVFENQAI
jgi:hypothetical protein